MAKLTLQDLGSGYGLPATYNANNALIEAALENTVSRDGTAPNDMDANLDMGGFRVMNIADAVASTDAVSLGQLPVPSVEIAVLTQDLLAGYLFPQTLNEVAASVVPTNFEYQEFDPRRYGATPGALSTTGLQTAINVAAQADGAEVNLHGETYQTFTLTIDQHSFKLKGPGKLIAHSTIPANGAIIVSLAGANADSDDATNQPLLDAIYGASVVDCRTNVTGSLERVRIEDIDFEANANGIRGIWMTRFTRGCRIVGCGFEGFDVADIVINGSWSFALIGNHCNGDGTNGVGIHLGITGNGVGSGAVACNAVTLLNNECVNHANGCIWNFGVGGTVNGNIFEFNVTDGFASQSVAGISVTGNYFEENGGDNLDMGGTNGTDFADSWIVMGNHFNNDTGRNIRLDGVKRCLIGPNNFSGTITAHYFINSAGGGANVLQNELWVPDVSGTYISNSSELNLTTNIVRYTDPAQYLDNTINHNVRGTFRHLGATLGFFSHALVAQPADISALTDNTAGTADNTLQACPSPADTPASADALRDDLVANLIPAIRNNFADLASQVNDIRTAQRNLGLMA